MAREYFGTEVAPGGQDVDARAAAALTADLERLGTPGGQGRPAPAAPPPAGGDSLPSPGSQTWAD
jgi:hypothetical protein